jgi:hypothetical protein
VVISGDEQAQQPGIAQPFVETPAQVRQCRREFIEAVVAQRDVEIDAVSFRLQGPQCVQDPEGLRVFTLAHQSRRPIELRSRIRRLCGEHDVGGSDQAVVVSR